MQRADARPSILLKRIGWIWAGPEKQPATANLTSIGGAADQAVINGVVQEIDITTGKVLFQWNSADHVPYSASEQPLPASTSTPWDWFHINAVHLDRDGNLLIDSRDTWTAFGNSRVVRVRLNERDRIATLEQSDNQPEGLTASSQGNGSCSPAGASSSAGAT